MANHPNRNWRRLAYVAAAEYIRGAELVSELPVRGELPLSFLINKAFIAGYAAGRNVNNHTLSIAEKCPPHDWACFDPYDGGSWYCKRSGCNVEHFGGDPNKD